jgi:hypothetical protein
MQGLVTVKLTHLGSGDYFLRPDSNVVQRFSHQPVTVMATYPFKSAPPPDVDAPRYAEVITGGGTEFPTIPNAANMPIDSQTGHHYTGIGPFDSWQLSVLPEDNEGLSLQDVTDVWLDFQGVNQPA